MTQKERKAQLNGMTLVQLKTLAKDYSIKAGTATKAELIGMITKHEKTNQIQLIHDEPVASPIDIDSLIDTEKEEDDELLDELDFGDRYDDEDSGLHEDARYDDEEDEDDEFDDSGDLFDGDFDKMKRQVAAATNAPINGVVLTRGVEDEGGIEEVQNPLSLNEILGNEQSQTPLVNNIAPKLVSIVTGERGHVIDNGKQTWRKIRENSFPDERPYLPLHSNWARWFNSKRISPQDYLRKFPNHEHKLIIAQLANSLEDL